MGLTMKFEVTGQKALLSQLQKLSKEKIDDALRKGVESSSELVLVTLKENTPVDTGALKESEIISYETDGLKSFIGPSNEFSPHYAPDVEYGFHHYISGNFIPGQYYVENTYSETKNKVVEIFRSYLKNIT